ncbi:hypothetical protein N9V16_07015 [SAR116 cluster bacterium]|nr:hypothetical protein [SAR116 cluster bacterium]
MDNFNELISQLSKEIQDKEDRRARSPNDKIKFDYALTKILEDIWSNYVAHPDSECLMKRRSNTYSENAKYRDPNLTYRMAMAAFDGLINLDMIRITRNGVYDRTTFQGNLTRYKATQRLIERIEELVSHPAIYIKPNLDDQTIIMRNLVEGRKIAETYDETSFTDKARKNLRIINACITRHWTDLMIKDEEYKKLQERLLLNDEKQPIDLTKKMLYRIFSNNDFGQGGRFYRGWWQNVPSEYRQFITIDSKRTQEYDFSQLNPNMIYSLYNFELGSEDAYSRVLDGEHRDTVKEAFNAMIQASTPLIRKPKEIDCDKIGMTWTELRQAVLDAHKPIQHLFFDGLGNQLQFEDSNMAEGIMLDFVKEDAPALPVHDSFIMHHGYAGELEESMRRTFYDRFGQDIKVKAEMIEEVKPKNDYPIGHPKFWQDISIEALVEGDKEYSQWQDRDAMWLSRKR